MDQVDVHVVEAAARNLQWSPTEASGRLHCLLKTDLSSNGIALPAKNACDLEISALHACCAKRRSRTPGIIARQLCECDSGRYDLSSLHASAGFRGTIRGIELCGGDRWGLKITTCHVKDLLHDGPDSPDAQLTSFCRLDSQKDFILVSAGTQADKEQAPLVLISSVLHRNVAGQPISFMVDSVHLVNELDVDAVKSCLKRLLRLTTLAGHLSSRRRTAPAPLTHEECPAKAAKCRVLGRSRTAT